MDWTLKRPADGLIKHSEKVLWIEWNESGGFDSKHEEPGIGRSLVMSPFNHMYTWLTTPITEIISQAEDKIEFKTENSHYILVKEKGENE